MILTFKLAETPEEYYNLFSLRHDVFAEEKKYTDTSHDGLLYDYFDTLPGAFNLILKDENRVIGGVRFINDIEFASPSEHLYNFKEKLPDNCKMGYSGMFILGKNYRKNFSLASTMVNLATVHASINNFDYVAAPVSPMAYRLLKSKGFECLGDKFIDEKTRLEVYPMVLNLRKLPAATNEFIAMHESYAKRGNYHRILCLKNDVIEQQFLKSNQKLHLVGGKCFIKSSKNESSNDHFFNANATINRQEIENIFKKGGRMEAHSDCLFVLE